MTFQREHIIRTKTCQGSWIIRGQLIKDVIPNTQIRIYDEVSVGDHRNWNFKDLIDINFKDLKVLLIN